MRRGVVVVVLALAAVAVPGRSGFAQLTDSFTNWIEHPAIAYSVRPAADPVARLNQRLQDGRVQLKFGGASGYLRATLDALGIPIESQLALFSRDSLQGALINSTNPRTIFFNDSVAVAFVRGGFLEIASQDPVQGVVFYALDNDVAADKPRFTRRHDCLNCHYSYSTVGIPGMLDRSYGQLAISHATPIEQRWGGWFVTGRPDTIRHQGNRVVARTPEAATPASATWPSLDLKVDTTGYLSSQSDIVALLAFNHQMRGMNFIGRIGWEARVAAFERQQAASVTPFKLPKGVASDAPVALADAARELVDYFLFVDEASLPAPVQGTSGFAERFQADGRRDHLGRSLRQLDLRTRLLRYPCSWLIYAEAFAALPDDAKEAIYQRLWRVLSGQEHDPKYARLNAADRRTIIDILRDTKPDLPSYFE